MASSAHLSRAAQGGGGGYRSSGAAWCVTAVNVGERSRETYLDPNSDLQMGMSQSA